MHKNLSFCKFHFHTNFIKECIIFMAFPPSLKFSKQIIKSPPCIVSNNASVILFVLGIKIHVKNIRYGGKHSWILLVFGNLLDWAFKQTFFAWKIFVLYPRFDMRSSLDKKDPFHRLNKREENESRVVKMYITITKGELTRMAMEAVGELFIFKCIFYLATNLSINIIMTSMIKHQ